MYPHYILLLSPPKTTLVVFHEPPLEKPYVSCLDPNKTPYVVVFITIFHGDLNGVLSIHETVEMRWNLVKCLAN